MPAGQHERTEKGRALVKNELNKILPLYSGDFIF